MNGQWQGVRRGKEKTNLPRQNEHQKLSLETYLERRSDKSTQTLLERIDEIIGMIAPMRMAALKRKKIVDLVQRTVAECLSVKRCYVTGSFPLKTYLPSSDIDMTIIVDEEKSKNDVPWYLKLMTALSKKAVLDHKRSESEKRLSIHNVTFVASDVKLLKCVVDNVTVDISANKINGIAAAALLADANVAIGREDLFIRSVLLIKTWCAYDAKKTTIDESILGGDRACLSSYALCILVLRLFNLKRGRSRIMHPFHAFALFFDEYASFPWSTHAITLYGSIPLADVSKGEDLTIAMAQSVKKSRRIPKPSMVRELADRANRASTADGGRNFLFPFRCCNILDPLDAQNNLGRSLTKRNFERLKVALRNGRQVVSNMIGAYFYAYSIACTMHASSGQESGQTRDSMSSPVERAFRAKNFGPGQMALSLLNGIFPETILKYGRGDGYRQDLLKHPFEVWVYRGPSKVPRASNDRRGRTQSTPVVGSSDWTSAKQSKARTHSEEFNAGTIDTLELVRLKEAFYQSVSELSKRRKHSTKKLTDERASSGGKTSKATSYSTSSSSEGEEILKSNVCSSVSSTVKRAGKVLAEVTGTIDGAPTAQEVATRLGREDALRKTSKGDPQLESLERMSAKEVKLYTNSVAVARESGTTSNERRAKDDIALISTSSTNVTASTIVETVKRISGTVRATTSSSKTKAQISRTTSVSGDGAKAANQSTTKKRRTSKKKKRGSLGVDARRKKSDIKTLLSEAQSSSTERISKGKDRKGLRKRLSKERPIRTSCCTMCGGQKKKKRNRARNVKICAIAALATLAGLIVVMIALRKRLVVGPGTSYLNEEECSGNGYMSHIAADEFDGVVVRGCNCFRGYQGPDCAVPIFKEARPMFSERSMTRQMPLKSAHETLSYSSIDAVAGRETVHRTFVRYANADEVYE